jgi:hypothetical protein
VGSNSAEAMDVCLLCLCLVLSCVGRGLCDGLITRPEESYRASNCVCDHRNLNREEVKPQVCAVVPEENTNCDEVRLQYFRKFTDRVDVSTGETSLKCLRHSLQLKTTELRDVQIPKR